MILGSQIFGVPDRQIHRHSLRKDLEEIGHRYTRRCCLLKEMNRNGRRYSAQSSGWTGAENRRLSLIAGERYVPEWIAGGHWMSWYLRPIPFVYSLKSYSTLSNLIPNGYIVGVPHCEAAPRERSPTVCFAPELCSRNAVWERFAVTASAPALCFRCFAWKDFAERNALYSRECLKEQRLQRLPGSPQQFRDSPVFEALLSFADPALWIHYREEFVRPDICFLAAVSVSHVRRVLSHSGHLQFPILSGSLPWMEEKRFWDL
jgi:hypothetical protein